MNGAGIAEAQAALAFTITEDEELAARSAGRLLITGATRQSVETLARRIHREGPRASRPFVRRRACDFPIEEGPLGDFCRGVLDAAASGTMLIDDVEEMPTTVQSRLFELLAQLDVSRRPAGAVRVIGGTTVPLLDCVAAGTFSEQMFYRLNVMHLFTGAGGQLSSD
jgi:DNA-binding NtrC family response regulator